jgi:hypothetical protein
MRQYYYSWNYHRTYKIYPYKFNAQWLNDKDFVDLVFKVWKDPVFLSEGGKQKADRMEITRIEKTYKKMV